MSKLVVFYSRADENYLRGTYSYIKVGNTEKAAKVIAEKVGADLFKIEQVKPYSKDYKTCIAEAREDQVKNARPELKAYPKSIDEYDEIYVGYPNYCGTMPMAVFSFLEHFNFKGKTIKPFCTHEGSGMGNSEEDIKKVCPNSNLSKSLPIHGSRVDKAESTILRWLQ